MPRIRTIKPEFWKSESIAALPQQTRLTFIGLWTYVDDNGVGIDNAKLVAAELYPLEEDPRETLASVQRDLARLANARRILRYAVGSKAYLEIANWKEHQKIDRPGKARHPDHTHPDAVHLSCENVDPTPVPIPVFDEPSRDFREGLATSHLPEQGTGNREQGAGIARPSASLQPATPILVAEVVEEATTEIAVRTNEIETTNAGHLLGAWIDHCTAKGVVLPPRVKGQYAKTIKENLDAKIHPDLIKQALGSMLADGVAHQPHWLAARIVSVQTGPERRRRLTAGESTAARLTNNGQDSAVVEGIQDFFKDIS